MSKKSERALYCKNKIYQILGKVDANMQEEKSQVGKQIYAPKDAPEQCKDCKNVRLKCYNPMKKQFGEDFIKGIKLCEKKVKKEE